MHGCSICGKRSEVNNGLYALAVRLCEEVSSGDRYVVFLETFSLPIIGVSVTGTLLVERMTGISPVVFFLIVTDIAQKLSSFFYRKIARIR
jgi:hypothetical protein